MVSFGIFLHARTMDAGLLCFPLDPWLAFSLFQISTKLGTLDEIEDLGQMLRSANVSVIACSGRWCWSRCCWF